MRFLLLILLSLPASAALQEWTFDDVHFVGGGDLLGTLTYDRDLHRVVDWDITTTDGTLPGFHYTPQTSATPVNDPQKVYFGGDMHTLALLLTHSPWEPGFDGGGALLLQNGISDYPPYTAEVVCCTSGHPSAWRNVEGYPLLQSAPVFATQLLSVPEAPLPELLLGLSVLLAVKYLRVLR